MNHRTAQTFKLTSDPISSDDVTGVLSRRVRLAPDHLVRDYIETSPNRVHHYLEDGEDYALVALYPPAEGAKLAARLRRFGQAFPGLFSVDAVPRPHDVRPDRTSQQSFLGGVHTRGLVGPLLLGAPNFKSVITTDCLLRLERDTSVSVARLIVRSPSGLKSFRYKVYFLFAMAFGHIARRHDFAGRFEDNIVRYFERNESQGVTEVDEGELTIQSSAA